MKISSSALSAVKTTHATDPSFKSSHSRLYANVEPTSVSHPVKASVDNDDDSSFYSEGTEDSDDDSSIAAVLEMRTPTDTVKDIDVVAQRDDYHCIPGRPYGYDIEENFQATSFLCGFGGQEWCSTQYTELANCGNFDDRSADAAYDFTTSTPKATPRSVKINENATCKDDDDDDDDESHNGPRHSPSIESQFEKISKETPRPVKINKNNNRSGPLYTPYFESQFEAVCSTGERPLHFVALRAIKALNRDVVIPVTIEKPGSLGLIVKDNADGVVCVVDVSPRAMEACRVLHPGDILAYRNNEKEEVIPEIEVLIKNGPIASSNPNKTSDGMHSLYDKLEVRATTDMASLGGGGVNKATIFTKILNNSKKNKWLYAYLSSCSLIQCGDSSTADESTDEPAESLDGIPQIEAINPDVLLESESQTINPESLCDEGLDEAQEETAEEQPPKSKVLTSRVISPDANLQSIEDEYFFGLKYIESMNSSDGSHLSTKEEDLIANKGIIPLLKRTGPERLADDLAEDIVSSIEAADIDAILDAVVEHLVYIFDRVIPDGKDDEDEYEDDDDDSELLHDPNNIEPGMPSKALTTDKDFSAIRKNAKDRKGTKFLRKVRRYRMLLHKRLNRSTVLCSGVDNNQDAESFGEEYDSHSDNSDYSAEKGPGIKLSMPEFSKYAEQGAERLQTLQKAVGNLQLQSKLGQAMEDVASQVKSDSASGQENEQIKPAQASPEELGKAWRNGCERALQQMNEEETAYLTAYTAATGTSALTAISELALLSTAVSKNASRTYKINNAAGTIDTVAGDIRDGDGGIGVLASKYVSRAQKDKERSARMEAMMSALAVERKNRSATKSCKVQSQEAQDAVSSRRKASCKYSASVSKGIKKGKVQSQETQDAVSSRRKASGKYSASVSKGIKKSSRERKGERNNGSRKEGKMV